MKRREVITVLGGAAAWPLAARAQQAERMRRIGMLTGLAGEDAQTKLRIAAFLQELQKFGWAEGRNLRTDLRAGAGDIVALRKYATELVALGPDVILATGAAPVASLLEATHTVPIVFATVVDPMGAGFVEKLSRPGGNATGFMMFDYSERKMARIAQTGCAERDTGGRASRYLVVRWHWPVCGDTGCGTVAWHGSEHDQCRGRTRDRSRGHRICARAEWRSHCDVGPIDGGSSRSNRQPGSAA